MRFTKMQGVGNDFVVLDGERLPPETDWAALAIRLCDRHFGIGADGLLVVARDVPQAAFSLRMFNPDGTEDVCGNGLRCVGLWAQRAGWVSAQTPFSVMTLDGPKSLKITSVAENGRAGTLQVGMGLPKFRASDIPFCGGTERVLGYPLPVGDDIYHITALNTGSTHTVIFGVVPPDEETFQRVSPLIETHPLFPERTSVLWATPQGDSKVCVRIWERGVGETLGCGTGACAVGIAARLYDTVGMGDVHSPVQVVSRGGTLEIDWAGDGYPVVMTGPAEFVFDGELTVGPLPTTSGETQF
jgi:diaminopimelate epimerase